MRQYRYSRGRLQLGQEFSALRPRQLIEKLIQASFPLLQCIVDQQDRSDGRDNGTRRRGHKERHECTVIQTEAVGNCSLPASLKHCYSRQDYLLLKGDMAQQTFPELGVGPGVDPGRICRLLQQAIESVVIIGEVLG